MVSVIIVGWNHCAHLLPCLKSIVDQNYKPVEVIYIDNASTDQSVKFVINDYPNTQIIENKNNLGFCHANNQGFSVATGEYIFQLNPDTILEPDCIQNLVAYLQSNPQVGLCGPKMLLQNHKPIINSLGMSLSRSGDKYHIGLGMLDNSPLLPGKVPFLSGAGIFGKAELIKSLKGLDENLFAYADDTEFSLRVWKYGYECHIVPNAVLVHVRNAAAKNSVDYSSLARFYAIRNHHYPYWKFFPLAILLKLCKPMFQYRVKYLWKGIKKLFRPTKPNPELRASIMSLFLFAKALRQRRRFKLDRTQFMKIFPDFI